MTQVVVGDGPVNVADVLESDQLLLLLEHVTAHVLLVAAYFAPFPIEFSLSLPSVLFR